MCKALEELMQDVIEEREKKAVEESSKHAAIVMYENNTPVEVIAKAFNVSTEKVEGWLGLATV